MIDDFRGGTKQPQQKLDTEIEEFFPDFSKDKQSTVISPEPAESFRTPEEVATFEDTAPNVRPVDDTIDLDNEQATPIAQAAVKQPRGPKYLWHRLTRWFSRLKPWQQILFGVVAFILLTGITFGAYTLLTDKPAPVAPKKVAVVKKEPPAPQPTTVPNTLTGRQVAPEINQRQVTAVMIENSTDARPQGGLQQAGVVFEAIAEGGITRHIALFQDTDAESIGPVRSVRPYYISWAQGFDAAIAHVGGSPEALQIMRDRGVKDLDNNTAYMQRVSFRYAPHNVFTSTALLRQYQDSKGYTSSSYTGFVRSIKPGVPVSPVTAGNIAVNISSKNYNSSYLYNPATNNYARTLAGVPHTDVSTKTQITPDVVVVLVMNYSIHPDGIHSVYNTVGSGQVYIFQNGGVTTGTWAKTDHTAQITFTDGSGKPIPLNPGQTWVSAVSSADKVTYTP